MGELTKDKVKEAFLEVERKYATSPDKLKIIVTADMLKASRDEVREFLEQLEIEGEI